jgi:drug/metabolite transporter (DMT)-like permease
MFSGYHVIAKKALNENANPLIFSFYRDLVCVPVMLLVSWTVDGRPVVDTRDMPRLTFLGLIGVFGNQVLFIIGLNFTSATNAAIMQVRVNLAPMCFAYSSMPADPRDRWTFG